jgi:hypothetical protein
MKDFWNYIQSQVTNPSIISVYRTRVDACDRLWFVDTGLLEYPSQYLTCTTYDIHNV